MCSPRTEFAQMLVASRPEDAFIDLIANSILGATILSVAVKIAFGFCLGPCQQNKSFPCQSFN